MYIAPNINTKTPTYPSKYACHVGRDIHVAFSPRRARMVAKTNKTAVANANAASAQQNPSLASAQNKSISTPVIINAKSP